MDANTEKREKLFELLNNPNHLSLEEREIRIIELIPECHEMYHFEHHQPSHQYNIFDHTMHVVDDMPRGNIGKLVALLHDIGKPRSVIISKDGMYHYPNHAQIGSIMAVKILRDLGFDEDTITVVSIMILLHDTYLDKSYQTFESWAAAIHYKNVRYMVALQTADLANHTENYYNKHKRQLRESHERIELFARCHNNAKDFDEDDED